MSESISYSEAERVARDSYGRLLAYLSARSHDITAAEDALADAFAAALRTWPERGVPGKPEAWLLTTARRRMLDERRHRKVVEAASGELALMATETLIQTDVDAIPDDRLKLLFICAHPAIDAAARGPLMLQTVLGLDVARMANAFLVAPATLSQRLVRAKSRIRKAGIPFDCPDLAALPARLQDVLDSLYAAYGTGWEDVEGGDSRRRGLTAEAIDVCRTLAMLLPEQAEPLGLLALMLFCEARAGARRTPEGAYVPLEQQDVSSWNTTMLREAEAVLLKAASLESLGPYQLEAAIQSAHTQRKFGYPVEPQNVVALYEGLVRLRCSIGAVVGLASARGAAGDAAGGLATLDALPPSDIRSYQPYWAARAYLLKSCGKSEEAGEAYKMAIGLSVTPAVRHHLLKLQAELAAEPSMLPPVSPD